MENVISPTVQTPPVIEPNAVYTLGMLKDLLGQFSLAPSCAGREIRLRRLTAAKRGGRCLVLGAWIIEWLEAGRISTRGRKRASA
jgi:hypothetical protein